MKRLTFFAVAAVFLTDYAFGQATAPPGSASAAPTAVASVTAAFSAPSPTVIPAAKSGSIPSEIWELIKDALTVVNLLLVWYIFAKTRVQQRADRAEDRRFREEERSDAKIERADQHKIEIGSFWIQRLILEPNRQIFDEFFDKYEAALKQTYENAVQAPDPNYPLDVAETRKAIRDFKTDYYSFRRRIIEPLCWVSNEFEALKEVSRQIDDLVSIELAMMPGALHGVEISDKHEPAVARLAGLRAMMVRGILEAQTRFARVHQME